MYKSTKYITKNLSFALIIPLFLTSCFQQKHDTNLAFITTENDGVKVIDLSSFEIIEHIKDLERPRGVAVSQDGKTLVTANKNNASLTLVDLQDHQSRKEVKVGENPEFIRLYGDQIFVSTEPSSQGKPVEHDNKLDDDDDDDLPAQIQVVDLNTQKILQTIEAGIETEGIEFTYDKKNIIVTNESDSTVSVHNIQTGKKIHSIDLLKYGKRPRGIKRSPKGLLYAVTMEHSNNVIFLSENYEVIDTIATGNNPYGIVFSADGDKLFVLASKSKELNVFDVNTREKVHSQPLNANRCWHMTFTPNNKDMLIACGGSDEVLVLDAQSYEEKKRLPVTGKPWGLVTYPKTFGSLDEPVYSY